MHRSGRRRQPQALRIGLPLFFIALAIAGAVAGASFGAQIIRSLIEATTPQAPTVPNGDVPPGPPITGPPVDPPPGAITTVEIKVPAKLFHAVQIGAYSDRASAMSAAAGAQERELPSAVWEPTPGGDSLFRVRCGITPTRAAAELLLPSVRGAGYSDSFVTSFSTAEMSISVSSTAAEYLEAFKGATEGLHELMTAMAEAYDAYATGGRSAAALRAKMEPVTRVAERVRLALAALTPPADLKERHDVLLGMINMADAAVVELDELAAGKDAKYQRAMSEYMGFVTAYSRLCATWR